MLFRARTFRRTWLTAICCMGVIAGGVPASALGQAPAPAFDSVNGSALTDFPPSASPEDWVPISIGGSSGPSGEHPGGGVVIVGCRSPEVLGCSTNLPYVTGDVTCLRVQGNRAIVGYYVGQPRPDLAHSERGLFEVVDQGPASAVADVVRSQDLSVLHSTPEDVPITDCPATLPAPGSPPNRPVVTGRMVSPNEPGYYVNPWLREQLQDFTVVDAHHPPASKDQCHRGGWHQYGFDSHQECVRAVEQQARLECIFIRAAHGTPAFRAWYGSGVHKRHAMRRCIRDRAAT